MTDDAELDMVASRVSSLESRVASVESQGSPDDAGVKAGQDGAPQPTVDPKGRKIWEAEWRQDYGVLLAYVPINALVIDGENVEVEADDKDGDEVTVTAGSWYLHVYKNETTGSYEADFDDSETGTRDGEDAKYNIRILDIHNDGYVEKQYVVGSIVLGKGGVTSLKGDDEDSEKVDGDVEIDGGKSGLTVKTELEEQDGNDPPKAKVTIDVKGRESASGCDNTENWGCQEIKLPGGGLAHFLGCHPIDLSNVMTKSGGGGGGGDDPDDPPDDPDDPDEPEEEKDVIDGTTYVRTISGQTEESDTVSGDLDFRCPEGSGLVVKTVATRQPTAQNPNTDGTVIVDLEGREDVPDCSHNFGIHQLKYRDKNGNTQIYHGLLCGDIDLTQMGKLIKNVSISNGQQPGSPTTVILYYNDGTQDTIILQGGAPGRNGTNGRDGKDGEDGKDGTDGEDGSGVVLSAGYGIQVTQTGNGGYVISNTKPCEEEDDEEEEGGDDDGLSEMNVISDISFQVIDGKIQVNLYRKTIKAKVVGELDPATRDIPTKELEVVTHEEYNTSSHKFTNTKKKITVIEVADATGETPFTATALSSE